MSLVFYFFLFLTIILTILSIIQNNIMYALFYLSGSILTTSMIFFLLGEYLIGIFQVIIYSGAIIVLFIFVIMMFNFDETIKRIYEIKINWMYLFFVILFFIILLYDVLFLNNVLIFRKLRNIYEIGINLFNTYILAVELISILLLATVIIITLINNVDRNLIIKNVLDED